MTDQASRRKPRWPRIALSAVWNPSGKRNLILENEIPPPGQEGRTYRVPKPTRQPKTAACR